MKPKNPILNFRIKSDSNLSPIDLKRHSIDKGFHEENIKSITSEHRSTATLITRSREAADMSENS